MDHTLAQRGGWVECLRLPAAIFGMAAWTRARLYDKRILPVLRVDVPVVSVGNLSVGGTGKTPFVEYLLRHFATRSLRVGVLARGYRRAKGELLNEEGLMLQERLPNIPQEQQTDRVAGALRLIDRDVDGIVLDDGFQHRRLYRDVDIVLMDATRPFGLAAPEGGAEPVSAFLPRGFLREGWGALKRAHAVVLTRSDGVSPERLQSLRDRVREYAPQALLAEARHRASGLLDPEGNAQPFDALRQREVHLVSGIGNPAAFEKTVRSEGMRVQEHRIFPDHHNYCEADFPSDDLAFTEQIRSDQASADPASPDQANRGRTWLTTAKDWPKLKGLLPAGRTWVLEVEMEILSGEAAILELLAGLPWQKRSQERSALHAGLHG